MKRFFLLQVLYIALLTTVLSSCAGKFVKNDSENFQFHVDETWRVKKWLHTAGELKITDKKGPNDYSGIFSFRNISILEGKEMLKNIKEVVDITVRKDEISMIGKEAFGSEKWSLDEFVFKPGKEDLLFGNSIDKKGLGGKIILSKMPDNFETIDSGMIYGNWNMLEKGLETVRRKISIKNFTLKIEPGLLKIVCRDIGKKGVYDMIFTGKWKLNGDFIKVRLDDFDFNIDLNNAEEFIRNLDTAKEDLERAREGLKKHLRTKVFNYFMDRDMFFYLQKNSQNEIEFRKAFFSFRFSRN